MSTFVGKGRGNVTAEELDEWVRFVYEAEEEYRDAPNGSVAPAVIAEEVAAEHRHRATVRRRLENDHRVVRTTGIGPRGPRFTFAPAPHLEEEIDTGEGIETDGGRDRKRRRDHIVEAVLADWRPSEQLRTALQEEQS